MGRQPWALSLPDKELCLREALAVKVLHSICQQILKTQQWPQDWKRSVFIPIPKKGNAKECSNYCIIALISHASKVMLKILQARLQQYVNRELPDVQAGFRKDRGTRDQIANTRGPDPSSKATLWVKAQHEGALPPPCIVRKDPRVPHTARRGA